MRCRREDTKTTRFPCVRDLVGPCQRCSLIYCRVRSRSRGSVPYIDTNGRIALQGLTTLHYQADIVGYARLVSGPRCSSIWNYPRKVTILIMTHSPKVTSPRHTPRRRWNPYHIARVCKQRGSARHAIDSCDLRILAICVAGRGGDDTPIQASTSTKENKEFHAAASGTVWPS